MARLIVPTDYSATAEKALDQALLLAQRHNDEVEVLHVVVLSPESESPKILEAVTSGQKTEEEKLRALAQRRMEALGISSSARWRVKVVYHESFLGGITGRFRRVNAKLVVMGTTGVSGLADKIFGSNTANLIGLAAVPVLAIPPNWKPAPLRRLEVCITPRQAPWRTSSILKWAAWFGAEVSALYFTGLAGLAPGPGKSLLPFKTMISPPDKPLYKDLVEYSKGLQQEALVMFVHERSFFENVFDQSITSKVAGRIQIPMLALPVKAR